MCEQGCRQSSSWIYNLVEKNLVARKAARGRTKQSWDIESAKLANSEKVQAKFLQDKFHSTKYLVELGFG